MEYATKLTLLSSKKHSKKANGGPVWTYRAGDIVSGDPRVAIMMCLGGRGRDMGVTELGAYCEGVIVRNAKEEIDQIHKTGKRCILVADLTHFPLITAYIDTRDQVDVFASDAQLDQYATDVIRVWRTYDQTKEIPYIPVNMQKSFVGLKILPRI
jgi:hypothetical protein